MNFDELFKQATQKPKPLPFQTRLALEKPFASLLDVPTGLGKTAAAILAWVWRRRFADESIRTNTPRRLAYCLPMRVLVEQTHRDAVDWLTRLGIFTEKTTEEHPGWSPPPGDHGTHPIAVHLLLGGAEKSDWALWPDRDAVLIGTQDMLLSRALNRGYAAGRARWPQEFGLLNSDCLWVFDEIQIMDTGLATTLQLDAWRRRLNLRPSREALPAESTKHLPKACHSLWMSATMAKHWLTRAVDWSRHVDTAWQDPQRRQLSDAERSDERLRSGQLFQIKKKIHQVPNLRLEKPKTKDNRADKADANRKQTEYLKGLAKHILANAAPSGLTLVIANTVSRATELYDLMRGSHGLDVKLIHSRFRPREREEWTKFLDRKDDASRVLISTQVVEAGVDLSAKILYTELAPWASLIQRFGRCARYPEESGEILWLDLDLGVDHWARPYERKALVAARERLASLQDAGLRSLSAIKAGIDRGSDTGLASTLFPYEPRFVPRDKDLFDLFDTTPDLTGADVDVSRFIRDGEELDVQVFWREVDGDPRKKDRPTRRELCPVPFHRFRDELGALRKAGRVWRRDYRKGWQLIDARDTPLVYPGQVFLLERSCGGYSIDLGWTGNPEDHVVPVPPEDGDTLVDSSADTDEADDLSELRDWFSIEEHSRDVAKKLEELVRDAGLSDSERRVLRLAARLHDWGKAHRAFQAKLRTALLEAATVLQGQPAAKAPDGRDRKTGQRDDSKNAWRTDRIRVQADGTPDADKDERRPGHRHELASALAILEALSSAQPGHQAFAWPDGLDRSSFGPGIQKPSSAVPPDHPLAREIAGLSVDELDLLFYLVASHHGKVRMSLRSSPDDDRDDVPDPCPTGQRQARGVRDGDRLPSCLLPAVDLAAGVQAPEVTLSLDPMELGLSPRYGASWRERTQWLLEHLGPFRLAYLEALLRAADCRASQEEYEHGRERT